MKKKRIVFIAVFIAIIVSVFVVHQKQEQSIVSTDLKNATYTIDGELVTLVDGYSKNAVAPGSASSVETRFFGNVAEGDFDSDGAGDAVFIITQDAGGSGTFYYAVLALGSKDGSYVGKNAIFMGDRIAPQTTEYRDGMIIVNYADRGPAEPMTAPPSIGVSRYFKVIGGQLAEIKQ